MLEAMAAEADRLEEAFDAGRPPDDRVIVGRERPEPGPAAGDARVTDDRHALDRLLHRVLDLAGVHRHVEVLADVLDVARAQENLLQLLPEVEAARDVGRERYGSGNGGERFGEEDVPASGVHGHDHAGQPRHARRRGPGGVDHERRGNRAGRSRDAAHAPVRALERLHADALDDLHAELARTPGEAGGDLGGAGEAVAGPPHRRDQVVNAQGRH